MTDSLCSNIIVGVGTGLVSSVAIAAVFYWRGRTDSEAVHRKLEIGEVLMRVKLLDPSRRQSVRGPDGVDDTCHWLICKSELMREAGFIEGSEALKKLEREIQQCPLEPAPTLPDKTGESQANEMKKRKWEQALLAVRVTF